MDIRPYFYYRNRLDAHDQKIVDNLIDEWMHMPETVTIPMPHARLLDITHSIKMDVPALFYIHYWYISLDYADNEKIVLRPDYLFEKEQARKNLVKVEKWVTEVLRKLPTGLDDLSKALWLTEVIILNCQYGDSENMEAHCVYGVAVNRIAVCEGLAAAYKMLCDLCNLPCIIVNGKLAGGNHSWNIVWIDGKPSFVDPTADLRDGRATCRNNFIRSSDEMVGYEWNQDEVPECKVKNLSNPFVRVSREEDLISEIRKHRQCPSMTLFLDYPQGDSYDYRGQTTTKLAYTADIGSRWRVSYCTKRPILYLDQPNG